MICTFPSSAGKSNSSDFVGAWFSITPITFALTDDTPLGADIVKSLALSFLPNFTVSLAVLGQG